MEVVLRSSLLTIIQYGCVLVSEMDKFSFIVIAQ